MSRRGARQGHDYIAHNHYTVMAHTGQPVSQTSPKVNDGRALILRASREAVPGAE